MNLLLKKYRTSTLVSYLFEFEFSKISKKFEKIKIILHYGIHSVSRFAEFPY